MQFFWGAVLAFIRPWWPTTIRTLLILRWTSTRSKRTSWLCVPGSPWRWVGGRLFHPPPCTCTHTAAPVMEGLAPLSGSFTAWTFSFLTWTWVIIRRKLMMAALCALWLCWAKPFTGIISVNHDIPVWWILSPSLFDQEGNWGPEKACCPLLNSKWQNLIHHRRYQAPALNYWARMPSSKKPFVDAWDNTF